MKKSRNAVSNQVLTKIEQLHPTKTLHTQPNQSMASARLDENTVKALLETHLAAHGAPRLPNQTLAVATDYLTLFLESAIERMIKEGRLQLEDSITSAHLASILPQLLLDSC